MEAIVKFIVENPLFAALLASPVGLVLVFALYKAVLKIVLSEKNIVKIAAFIDKAVDKLQKQDPESGKETRAILIELANRIIKDLKAPDGCN